MKNMNKISAIILLLSASLSSYAQQWIDVTDQHIINPRYDNNDVARGWQGTALGAVNAVENAEHYNKNYDTWQELSGLRAGKYRVSLNAFYRCGNAGNDYNVFTSNNYQDQQFARFYAHSAKGYFDTPIPFASSERKEQSLGGNASLLNDWTYIPNNMEAAHYWFEAGCYLNQVECEVDNDGLLTIGFKKEQTVYEDWTCIDNWKLEYWGEFVEVSNITLSSSAIDLVQSETADLVASVYPSSATFRNVTWESSRPSVATVDNTGHITALSVGITYIYARAKDDSGKYAVCRVNVKRDEPTSENLVINEIMAANIDVYLDPSFNYGCWVEVYNPTDRSVTLGGLYVSDDPNHLTKNQLIGNYGTLEPHGFAILNFDHHEVWKLPSYKQIDDKLDADGGVIILSDGKNIFAQQEYPPAISRTSYARLTDGGSIWGTTYLPSPGTSNQLNGGFADRQLEAPVVDKNGQRFQGIMQICVNIPQGATLRYTTDGTCPTMENGQTSTTRLFNVDETVCYRFRLFQDGYLPSTVITRSYIRMDNNYPFNIISVVTDEKNLYSTEYGVFKQGPNGRPGNGQSVNCNWNMDWDRPVSFEYITTDNEYLVSQECDLSICGGWTRASNPKSFKLKATKIYDFKNFFAAQLFEEKPYIKNKTLQIRNGGNDGTCRIKDASIQQVIAKSGINVDHQAWEPVHVFINGSHYAVLNMREPNNKHHAYANYGIDTDEMDQFEISPDSGYVQMEGTKESFDRLVKLSENAADAETYKQINTMLDVDEYINYMAIQLYLGNWDWPQNNVKGFRDVNDGKYHFVLFDLDGSFNLNAYSSFSTFFNKENYTFDRLYGYDYSQNKSIDGVRHQKNNDFVTLFRNMLQNETFRKHFIDSFCIVGGSVFQPNKVEEIVTAAATRLSAGGFVNPWNTANNVIYNLQNRNDAATQSIYYDSRLNPYWTDRQQVKLSTNIPDAKISINDIEVPYSEFDGYLYSPITLKAQTPAGYQFLGWKSSDATTIKKTIFTNGSSWEYYDAASLDNVNWKSSSYNANTWKTGDTPIGYGKNQNTEVENKNQLCYYFRKSFDINETPSAADTYLLDYTIDDGMIIYVNGVEAGRYNMRDGESGYNVTASTYAVDNPDQRQMSLSGSLFKKGKNVIAVEVHNHSTGSTDILWDAALSSYTVQENGTNFISTESEFIMPDMGSQNLIAVFEKKSDFDLAEEGITPIRINEISAANSIYMNDYFKKNDWIELYNTTDDDIDIKGMYISDNKTKPQKYQVPSDDVNLNTIIPARGYKVIWCDKLDNIGSDIHTSFKLASEGGDVVITTDEYADTLSYTNHLGIQTFGRYPDGNNDTYVMNIPTIGKANQIGSCDILYVKPVEEPEEPNAIRSYTKEGGITIAYVDGVINVKSEDAAIRSVNIYNASGVKMEATQFINPGQQFTSIYVATLPKGIYIAKATTQTGDECHIKFFIR